MLKVGNTFNVEPVGYHVKKEKYVFDVCVCFVVCKFVSGLIWCFLGKLWFDDLCEE